VLLVKEKAVKVTYWLWICNQPKFNL